MGIRHGRRKFLTGLAIVAFDPIGRSWLTEARASSGGISIPNLDGELVMDVGALAEAGDDFGHIIQRMPVAVLRPGSIRDVQRLVRFANRHRIKVAMRGQGHTTFGQAQVEAGVVIDSRTLNTIHHIGPGYAVVDTGVQWIELLTAAVNQGQTPPVLTDYLELSIGGVLQTGGIGGNSNREGLVTDQALELEVVTGRGRRVRCSPTRRPALFRSVIGGLGQFGIIVRAKVRLVPAPERARVFRLTYTDIHQYVADQTTLSLDERFSYLEGQIIENPGGGWQYLIEAVSYFTPPNLPDEAALLAGLNPDAGTTIEEVSFFDWQNRLAPAIEFLRDTGVFFFPHPWIDVFIPQSQVASYIDGFVQTLTPADVGPGGAVLLYPFRRSKLGDNFVTVPSEEVNFLFSLLRTAPPDAPEVVDAMVAANRVIYEDIRDLGGKRYPIGSLVVDRQDWVDHFGPDWAKFVLAKALFDPRRVLTPGQSIFN